VSSADAKTVSPDLALVSAIRSGDQSAMASLYDRHSSVVYSVALRVLGDTGAAEDITDVELGFLIKGAIFDHNQPVSIGLSSKRREKPTRVCLACRPL
jgi:hypothetical protein